MTTNLREILECKNRSVQPKDTVFPIFYDVKPTVVRKQKNNFKEAFAKHEKDPTVNVEKVKEWRNALKEVANFSGWELNDRNESEFIEDIAKEISSKLIPKAFETRKELVGMNSRLEEFMLLLDRGFDDVRMIGICGMGGLGKTTIARVVYDLISWQFEGSSFVADVREVCEKSCLISLQKQLLSELLKLTNDSIWNGYEGINILGSRLRRKKVLLVIDDVVDVKQLERLAGKHAWFGSGSRIIITSRNNHLLMTHGVDEVYKLDGLDVDEARRLLCLKAFKGHEPRKDYEHLCERVVQYASGIPLALTVLGSFLYGKTVREWESALQRLKRDLDNEILDILQISFDGLKETEKNIFLDIACFFKGEDRDYVTDILEGFDFDPIIGICVLIEKSLISVNNNILEMHDLLQEMGHRIVKRESKEPGKRSRLWEEAHACHVLSKNTGTEVIEGITYNLIEAKTHFSARVISKMTNLRLLKISDKQLPNLDMYCSSMKQLWQGIRHLYTLKVIIFDHCQNLFKTPDFTRVLNLEELFFIGCARLQEICPSLLVHKKLTVLYIKDCTSLESLPRKIGMNSLKKLVLSGCSRLGNFPEIGSGMECLLELFLDGTAITELPLSFGFLYGLLLLSLRDCKKFKSLPCTLSGFKCLQTLNLSGCSELKKFPEIMTSMECLLELFLDGTAITELPLSIELLSGLVLLSLKDCKNFENLPSGAITGLKRLKTLNLSGCSNLRKFPENVERMECLSELSLDGTAIEELPSSIGLLSELVLLNLNNCNSLVRFPSTMHGMISLKTLYVSSCRKLEFLPENYREIESLELFDTSKSSIRKLGVSPFKSSSLRFLNLTEPDLSDCNLGEGAIPIDICNLFSLKSLILSIINFFLLPGTINRLSKPKYLMLEDCKRLKSLPELPSSIENVRVDGCASLETLSKVGLYRSFNLSAVNCLKLVSNNDLAFSMLKEFLEVESKPGWFDIVVPGSKIAEWFRYQNEGPSITIKRPPDSYNDKKKLVGYAICSVFPVHKQPPIRRSSPLFRSHELNCHMKADKAESSTSKLVDFNAQLGKPVSDHLWLLYLSNQELHASCWNFGASHVELSFLPSSGSGPGLVVKRCGNHPVYVDKADEFNNTAKEWNINESDDRISVVGSKMDVATTLKLSRTEYAGAEASASDEEPHAKRFRELK